MAGIKNLTTKFRYLDLIREIGISDFKVKYNNSILGYFWSLGKPILLFLILYIVFYKFLKFGANIPNFPVYLLLGVVIWSYFAEATLTAMYSVVGKGGLIRKVYFPREVIVISSSITTLLTFLLNMLVVLLFILILRIQINIYALLMIPIIIELYLFTLAVSLILSAMFVKYRDIGHIWEVVLQGLFYATPVIYAISAIPEQFRTIIMLNPMAQIIQSSRYVLITQQSMTAGQILPGILKIVPYIIVCTFFIFGVIYFRSAASSFAEDV